MSDFNKKMSEAEVIEILERFENEPELNDVEDVLLDLDPQLQEEINQALDAQKLLAQLVDVHPPKDLPINTARRARRRRRYQTTQATKSWLDLSLSFAALVLIIVLISIVAQQVQDSQSKQNIEQINPVK